MLYTLPPDRFVAERDRLVAEARRSGDRAGARALAALRRPTTGAWLANQLARHRPREVAALIDLGADLRAAQRDLDAGRLRELTRRRRSAVASLGAEAAALAAASGVAVTPAAGRDLAAALDAALADAGAAERLRSGRLGVVVERSGLDLLGVLGAGTAAATGRPSAPSRDEPDGPALAAAERPGSEPAPADAGADQARRAARAAAEALAGRTAAESAAATAACLDADRAAESASAAHRERVAALEEAERSAAARRAEVAEAAAALADRRAEQHEAHAAADAAARRAAAARCALDGIDLGGPGVAPRSGPPPG